MSGSMSSLYIGTSGVSASQNALNATAHNLANVDTIGYVRQQVLMTDSQYLKVGESTGTVNKVGLGTEIATVRQIRNNFLDQGYRLEVGRQGFYESQYSAVSEVESVFGELEGIAFQDSIEDFWIALQELQKEPDSIVTRASIIETAVSFMERASEISNQLNAYQTNLNIEIKDKVAKINSLADQIHKFNQDIIRAESNGLENANDLRDKRNNCLDQLGQLVKITYREDTSGVISVVAENVPLVTEDTVNHMVTEPLSEGSRMLNVLWEGNEKRAVFNFDRVTTSTNNTDIGYLKGLILARGTKVANYTDIPVAPTEPKRANYASDADYTAAIAGYEVALSKHEIDKDKYNKEVLPSVIMTAQAQLDQLIHGIVTTINNVLCPNKEMVVQDPDFPLDPTKTKKITVLDTDKAPRGMDEDKTFGEALFERKSVERYTVTEVTLLDGTKKDVYLYNEENPKNNYSLYTVGEIEVNPDILKNYSKLPLNSNSGTGEFDIVTVTKLASLWQEPFATLDPNALTKNNFNEYYNSFVSEIANRGKVYDTISNSQESLVASIDDKRLQTTGVSSDEELSNLIKYQHAYNAAARYVNVVSQMLEHLVTRL